MFASTTAFCVWALSVPGAPLAQQAAKASAGIGALIRSTLLNLGEPFFEIQE
jgi:hypothetical protein